MVNSTRYLILLVGCLTVVSCQQKGGEETRVKENTLFQRLPSDSTGIVFQNTLVLQEDFDVFRYRNYYNGGGVGIGDINNDGLADVYLTSNMGGNKLYLNKGNWKFEDITEKAGVKGNKVWSTGVSFADVNADGLLDIYVCNSGDIHGGRRENELFINNGDLTFTEQAEAYGLADGGFSTHAAFFDYDKDGDLDCYVLNNSFRPISTLGYKNLRDKRDDMGGDKLYENREGKFQDVSEAAGIYGSVIGFGLGVTVGDVNGDHWPDLYISNDFYERDYLYINRRDGTFSEELEQYIGHLSMYSMGADMADINNDGYPEIFSTDMLPEQDYRLKTISAFETYDVYQIRLKNGYYHQFMRNMLHLNNRDGSFSEIGQLAGVSNTDWSWGALMADFNNDTHKDIFVCNGIYKDVTNQDFVDFFGSSEQIKAAMDGKKIDFQEFVNRMPSEKLSNFMFTRTAPLQYRNAATEWGLDEPSFSNGAAYGDLDNDGDLDLIVNNVNQELFVYRNQTDHKDHHYISLSLKGSERNTFALGTKVMVYYDSGIIAQEHMPIRGFQSSMDYRMTIGLGAHTKVDSMVVLWPDNRLHIITHVPADQHLQLDHAEAMAIKRTPLVEPKTWWKPLTQDIRHRENAYNDFDRDRLLYHMMSTQGPAFAQADVNGDGAVDFFLGNGAGKASALYIQKGNSFISVNADVWAADSLAEDVAAVFFDMDADGDQDLYVVTGGNEYTNQSPYTADRLYENKGVRQGVPVWEKTSGRLPVAYLSGSCARPADVDRDGDIDLFVGTRVTPTYYGMPADQILLLNDGKGNFTDATNTYAVGLRRLGMVTDAAWFDYDGNGYDDLMLVGDWMPVTLFLNDGKQLTKSDAAGLENTAGWWNCIRLADVDDDGDMDAMLGNLGMNSKFRPSQHAPLWLYVGDFDQNGSVEPVFAFERDGRPVPIPLRQDMIKQMSSLKKQFVYYKDYATKTLTDIFEPRLLERAVKLSFREPRTSLLLNQGKSGFTLQPLPVEAQFAPVYDMVFADADGDGQKDIILGGNLFAVKPEVGRYDAFHGLVLKQQGKGQFVPVSSTQSGIDVTGEVRHIALIPFRQQKVLAFIRNNESIQFYQSKK